MAKNRYILLICLFVTDFLFAQENLGKYIIYFGEKKTDKNIASLFSPKAIENRKKYNIQLDVRDYPVNENYVEQLKKEHVIILNTSNWLNAVLVSVDRNSIKELEQLPFVSSVVKVEKTNVGGIASVQDINECAEINGTETFEDNYGSSFSQFHLLNGEYLHEQGFNGENMTIAICDNGFYNVNNNTVFSHIFNDNRLLGTYDYVHNDSLVYDESGGPPNYVSHGSYCLSFIGGLKANQYIGTATKSNFYLFHTEDNGGEQLQEEFNLAAALERCSQLGVDVVSISLGYLRFDGNIGNHDTSDLRKNITPSAKAVNIASSKGILVCVAAGNKDFSQYINTPADADSAFAIASIDVNGTPASSSSLGLPNDPRIKPNVAAVGQNPFLINTSGQVGQFGSGTSFATPSLAGMATCLWQAFPSKTNWEIKTAIEQSASQYLTPDKKIGYGIPDFHKAYQLLATSTFVSDKNIESELEIYPNPFQSTVNIVLKGNIRIENIDVLTNIGQVIYSVNTPLSNTIVLNDLPKGMYLLQIATNKGTLIKKLIKD